MNILFKHLLKRTLKRTLKHALTLSFSLAAFSNNSYAAQCYAVDGDTLRCGQERVRLSNVYAAERTEAGGFEAKQNLAALVNGKNVQLRRAGTDKYGRTLATVAVDGHTVVQSDIGAKAGRGVKGYVIQGAGARTKATKEPKLRVVKIEKVKKLKVIKAIKAIKAPKTQKMPKASKYVKHEKRSTIAKATRVKTPHRLRSSTRVRQPRVSHRVSRRSPAAPAGFFRVK